MNWTGLTLGKYHLIKPIDTDGITQVYKAYQPDLDRYVAVKVIVADLENDPTFHKQFEREAKTLAQLEHPNILPIYDYGYHENIPYLVTPFTSAGTLADQAGRQLPPEQVVNILCQVGDALGYAHAMGVVHQNVKPANILFAESGRILLTNFSLKQTIQPQKNASSNTSAYMAPEQRAGKSIDGRTDIYTLGILFYELLTGKQSGNQNLLTRSLNANRLPDPLTNVIACATDTQPDNRYELAEDFVAAAQEALLKIKGEYVEPPTSTQQALEVVIIAILVLVGLGAGIYALKQAVSFIENAQAGRIGALDSVIWMPAVTGSISCLAAAALLFFRDRTRALSFGMLGIIVLILVSSIAFIIPLSILFEALVTGIPASMTTGKLANVFGSTLVCALPGILMLFAAGYLYKRERGKARATAQQNIPPPQVVQSAAARRARLKSRRIRNSLVKYVIVILLVEAAARVVAYLAPSRSILARVTSVLEYDLLLNSVLIGVALLAWYIFNQITSAAKDDADEMPSQTLSSIEERSARLDKAYEYQARIKAFIAQTREGPLRKRLQTATRQLDDWVAAIERLTTRLNELERNPVIRRDRNAVPRAIHMLEARFNQNPDLDPGVEAAARQTLAARQTQLRQLRALERVMAQAELQSEETVAALGTIYSQVLLVEAKDTQGRRAQRLQADIDEQAQTLRDLLHAMDDVQSGRTR